MKKYFALSVILIMIATGQGLAADAARTPAVAKTAYSRIDANGDRVVTVTEHAAFWQGRFKDIDVDRDGKLVAEEFNAATREFFGSMDKDADGTLVAKEYFAFWCGPNRPNPHSWLSRSVVCRAPVDFRIEFLDAQGDSLETLAFAGVPPGSYRLRLREQSRTQPGVYTLRYIYAGAVVDRSKVKIDEPR